MEHSVGQFDIRIVFTNGHMFDIKTNEYREELDEIAYWASMFTEKTFVIVSKTDGQPVLFLRQA